MEADVKRIWAHLTSPLSARTIIAVLLGGAIALLMINEYFERRRSEQTHQEILQNQEDARLTREDLKDQNAINAQAVTNIQTAIDQIPSLTRSVRDVADILKMERYEREQERLAMIRTRSRRRRSKRAAQKAACYELKGHAKQIGSTSIIVYDLVPKDKCQ